MFFQINFYHQICYESVFFAGVPLWNLELRLWICTCPRSFRRGLHDLRYTPALWSAGSGTGGAEVHSVWQVPCPNPTLSTAPSRLSSLIFLFMPHLLHGLFPAPDLLLFFFHFLNGNLSRHVQSLGLVLHFGNIKL